MTNSKSSDANSKGIVSPAASESERVAEAALRPRRLNEFVGQETVRSQLSLVLEMAMARGGAPDHILLPGLPGLDKTTLSMIIAAEVNGSLRLISDPVIQNPGDLAAVLSSLQENDVFFTDEIHRLIRTAEKMLYLTMEDSRVDVMVDKGSGAASIPLPLPPFTVAGATTRAGLPPAPLRNRSGFAGHLGCYEEEELALVVTRNAVRLQANLEADTAHEITSRLCDTPRIANRLFGRVQDWAQVRRNGVLDLAAARAALDVLEVDRRGFDRLNRTVLETVYVGLRGGPVGLTTLAVSVGEEPETIETVARPYLVRESLLLRTPRGRTATRLTFGHLGLSDSAPEETLFG